MKLDIRNITTQSRLRRKTVRAQEGSEKGMNTPPTGPTTFASSTDATLLPTPSSSSPSNQQVWDDSDGELSDVDESIFGPDVFQALCPGLHKQQENRHVSPYSSMSSTDLPQALKIIEPTASSMCLNQSYDSEPEPSNASPQVRSSFLEKEDRVKRPSREDQDNLCWKFNQLEIPGVEVNDAGMRTKSSKFLPNKALTRTTSLSGRLVVKPQPDSYPLLSRLPARNNSKASLDLQPSELSRAFGADEIGNISGPHTDLLSLKSLVHGAYFYFHTQPWTYSFDYKAARSLPATTSTEEDLILITTATFLNLSRRHPATLLDYSVPVSSAEACEALIHALST
ncbi:hypothetical protein BP5796_09622 [Coleophoma crateriformis]|uniref:Uncharacterized protein n=1 Tax=Coleophoma crateriformis TaxID=565419 RepID=A0A3D8QYH1_9HELO|nr:hypothetical protein BP5796_09622 [Coleophoma crateriformis]